MIRDAMQHKAPFERFSNGSLIDTITARIRNNLKVYFYGLPEGNVKIAGVVWGGQETARVFKFTISPELGQHSKTVYAKLCPVFESLNPAKLEYETLCLLHDRIHLANEMYSVARPIDYFSDLDTYLMESVGERSFKSYLLNNNTLFRSDNSLSELFSIVSDCAGWLQTFHEITSRRERTTFYSSTFVEQIIQEYDIGLMKNYRFQVETISQLERLLDNLSTLDGKISLPCAKWHWDFTPGHVFLDHGKISVIDITGIDNIPIYEDIGRFLATISTVNSFPFHPFFNYKRSAGKLCDIFIESYFSRIENDKEEFLLLSQIFKLKYLLFWFFGQRNRVDNKLHPFLGNVFANLRLVPIFERSILQTIGTVKKYL